MIDWKQFGRGDILSRLALFQTHLERGGLAADDAFRMLDVIHTELERQHGGQHAAYARYAGLMRQLQQTDASLYDQVVERYRAGRANSKSDLDHEAQEPTTTQPEVRAPATHAAAPAETEGEEAEEEGEEEEEEEEGEEEEGEENEEGEEEAEEPEEEEAEEEQEG